MSSRVGRIVGDLLHELNQKKGNFHVDKVD